MATRNQKLKETLKVTKAHICHCSVCILSHVTVPLISDWTFSWFGIVKNTGGNREARKTYLGEAIAPPPWETFLSHPQELIYIYQLTEFRIPLETQL